MQKLGPEMVALVWKHRLIRYLICSMSFIPERFPNVIVTACFP